MERHISWDHPGFRLLAGRKIQIGIAIVAAIGLIGSRVLHASATQASLHNGHDFGSFILRLRCV